MLPKRPHDRSVGLLFGTVLALAVVVTPALSAGAADAAPASAAAEAAPVPALAPADTSDFEFASFAAEYELSRAQDGTSRLSTVETIVAVFPEFDQNRGIIRAIPDSYQGIPLYTEVESVTDAAGEAVPFGESEAGDFIELALGTDEFVHGEQTYVISYEQQNVVGAFEDTASDEFYWDVNGTGWEQPFGEVSARVTVAPELVDALSGATACYSGAQGDTTQCEITGADDGTFTASVTDLAPGETLTFAIGFDAGTFVPGEPEPTVFDGEVPWWTNLIVALFAIASVVLLGLSILSRVRASRANRPGTIVPQYSVPDGLNVMVAAHLVGRAATAIPAQLVSLAVRRRLRILDYPVSGRSGAEYSLQFLDERLTDDLERRLLKVLFGKKRTAGRVKELGPHDTDLGDGAARVIARAQALLIEGGLHEAGQRRSGGIGISVTLFLLPAIMFLALVGASFAGAIPVWSIAVFVLQALAFLASLFFIPRPPRLTALGREHRDYLLGMRMYLELAEQDRMRMLQSPEGAQRVDIGDTRQVVKLYEKLLPFAVIWGVEDAWAKELEITARAAGESPDWFVSTDGFNGTAFTSTLNGVSRSTTARPAPSYSGSDSSSFSGGSMGGGFSGGGGGGGGGGGR
ncbi:putative membrane protein DUF2207 [Diaminobutyricimonas aerilata]|uniref:Putative membrane protein DUF2207 n=1 Tax=Diaminobutyricimonas aerilata TaxID=1162967 RepID=A0A2M9CNT9_9MICO|nr:DUF2207 domain-containing protein [Diaminobutyricimonas aerilata]PJJ73534.1 putative membrane protein DUF2207 [Diaminobutyricimonas aerilata]